MAVQECAWTLPSPSPPNPGILDLVVLWAPHEIGADASTERLAEAILGA